MQLNKSADLPSYDAYMLPILQALKTHGGSMTIEEMAEDVPVAMGLTDGQRNIPHVQTGRSEVEYRMAWERTYLKKAGALENSERGVWLLTPKGMNMTSEEVRTIPRKVAQEYSAGRAAKEEPSPPLDDPSGPTWIEQLRVLQAMEPSAFERLCQRLLRESGFTKVEVTGKSGDGGIDGVGVLRVNLLSFQVLFQCKRWKGSVGASVVRDFRGAMVGRTDKGLIITTGTFSADARREATRDGAPAIDLVDGEALCDLLKDRGIGVRIKMVEDVTVDEAALTGS
jgi:restriction system protein